MGFSNYSMFCCALLCVHSSFAVISMGKRERGRAGCFALLVFLVSHDCCVVLLHRATGLSAVCDCGISRAYSFTENELSSDLKLARKHVS